MFTNSWCGGMGIAGWLAMLVFWATFLGLAIWAVTRMFPTARTRNVSADSLAELDRSLTAGELDADTHRRVRVAGAGSGRRYQGRDR